MKKHLLFSLLCISSMAHSFSVKNALRIVFGPVQSIECEAGSKLKSWHEKRDGKYFWSDDSYTDDGRCIGDLRSSFPSDDSKSVDKLSKALLLAKHNRLLKVASAAIDPAGGQSQTFSSDFNYEETWKAQPMKDRVYWTLRYRRPYTYCLSLTKWAAEAAIVIGCIKIAQKIKKYYRDKQDRSDGKEESENKDS